jgi:hypothetical protein
VSAVTRTVWIVTAPIKAAKVQLGGFLFLALMRQELVYLDIKMLCVIILLYHTYMVFATRVAFIPAV